MDDRGRDAIEREIHARCDAGAYPEATAASRGRHRADPRGADDVDSRAAALRERFERAKERLEKLAIEHGLIPRA